MQAIAQQREADKAQRQHDAATAAAQRWEAAEPAPADHPYLVRKGIQPHGIKAEGEALLIPLRDAATTLHSLQAIGPEGDKRFQPGGRIKGCYFGIGKPKGVLIVCEGFATGASIHGATGHAVACAMNAGNLLEVAQALHSKYPTLQEQAQANDTVDAFANGAYETKLNNAVVDALDNHSAMADQALRHEKVFKGLANLLVEEVYRQLRGKKDSAETLQA